MKNLIGIAMMLVVCIGCQTVVDQSVEQIADQEAYEQAIEEQSQQLLLQMQKAKSMLQQKYQEAIESGATQLTYEAYARDMGSRMKKVMEAKNQKRAQLMQDFPNGDADLSVLDAYANEVRIREGVPDWYWEVYPKATDIKEATKAVIEMRKEMQAEEVGEDNFEEDY